MHKFLVIHGPNLNLLGKREPEFYGTKTSEDLILELQSAFPMIELSYFQSNSESEIVDKIHSTVGVYQAVLINAGAFSHTSITIADAIKSVKVLFFNIHISNIYQRESFRHTDIVGEMCKGSIVGLGFEGYHLAIETILDEL